VANDSRNANNKAIGAIQRTPFLCSVQVHERSLVLADGEGWVTTIDCGGRYGSVGRGGGIVGAGGGAASIAAPVSAGGVNVLPHCGHGDI
jgi:hypothetical protein